MLFEQLQREWAEEALAARNARLDEARGEAHVLLTRRAQLPRWAWRRRERLDRQLSLLAYRITVINRTWPDPTAPPPDTYDPLVFGSMRRSHTTAAEPEGQRDPRAPDPRWFTSEQ